MPTTNKCINCGKIYEYEPVRGTYKSKYCSAECKKAYKEKENSPQYRICKHCGKSYWWDGTTESYGVPGNFVNSRLFCCYECGKADKYAKVRETTIKNFGGIGYSSAELLKKSQKTCIEKYGSLNNTEKRKATNLKRYGFEVATKSDVVKDKLKRSAKDKDAVHWKNRDLKSKVTKLKRYGDENYVNVEKAKETCLKRYGTDNYAKTEESKEKIKKTCIEKYGTCSASENAEIAKKISDTHKGKTKEQLQQTLEKRKHTCLKKYGVEFAQVSEEVKEKIKATNVSNFGKPYAIQSDDVQNKIKEHNIKCYGTEYSIASEEVQNKIKLTNLKKYGYEYPFENQDNRKKLENKRRFTNLERYGTEHLMQVTEFKEKVKDTCMKKYGVLYNCMTDACVDANHTTVSKTNLVFKDKLEKSGLQVSLEFRLNKYSYDLKVNDILLEINPTYTHNSSALVKTVKFEIKPKSSTYHLDKTKFALENGYKCIHVWDWDDKEKVIDLLKPKKTLYARKLKLKEVTTEGCDMFLNKYHLQNTCKGQTIRLGLYNEDELIEIMTFGKPRYNKNYDWELLRLCTKAEYRVIGGVQRLFTHFKNVYAPLSIISYCDNSKFSGNVYQKLGMRLKSEGKPGKHWYNISTKKHITDNLLRQRGYSQLHDDKLHKKGENNEKLMLESGYLEVYDCGQSTYIWKK